jgi:dihydroorotase
LELLLPLTLKWAHETRTPLPDALRKITGDPMRILGLEMRTAPGAIADLCISTLRIGGRVEPARC